MSLNSRCISSPPDASDPSPPPPSSSSTAVALAKSRGPCFVCKKKAYGLNYGVRSCNACKMFFRRGMIEQNIRRCKKSNTCYARDVVDPADKRPNCQRCRFNRCIEVGMKYPSAEEEEKAHFLEQLRKKISSMSPGRLTVCATTMNSVCDTLQPLLKLDVLRIKSLETMRTNEDPSIADLIDRRFSMFSSSSSPTPFPAILLQQLSINGHQGVVVPTEKLLSQWSFYGVWCTIELFNNLPFMQLLDDGDKQILLKNFAMGSYLLTAAFKSSSLKSARLVNPDGSEMFPSGIRELCQLSEGLVTRMQSLLVSRFNDLEITSEEYILATVILFCNPALSGLSERAQKEVYEQQMKFSNAFFEYCRLTRGSQCGARFHEIVSLGNVITRCLSDMQALSTILQMHHPEHFNSKKLLRESLNE